MFRNGQTDKRTSGLNGTPVSTPVNTPVSTLVNTLDTVDRTLVDIYEKILSFCIEAKGILEIADMLGYKEKKSVRKYLNPLIAAGW